MTGLFAMMYIPSEIARVGFAFHDAVKLSLSISRKDKFLSQVEFHIMIGIAEPLNRYSVAFHVTNNSFPSHGFLEQLVCIIVDEGLVA
jgi:hypothetical protein